MQVTTDLSCLFVRWCQAVFNWRNLEIKSQHGKCCTNNWNVFGGFGLILLIFFTTLADWFMWLADDRAFLCPMVATSHRNSWINWSTAARNPGVPSPKVQFFWSEPKKFLAEKARDNHSLVWMNEPGLLTGTAGKHNWNFFVWRSFISAAQILWWPHSIWTQQCVAFYIQYCIVHILYSCELWIWKDFSYTENPSYIVQLWTMNMKRFFLYRKSLIYCTVVNYEYEKILI